MLLPLLYFEATEAVLLYLVSGVALKVETSRWLSSGKLVAPKEDNIHYAICISFTSITCSYLMLRLSQDPISSPLHLPLSSLFPLQTPLLLPMQPEVFTMPSVYLNL